MVEFELFDVRSDLPDMISISIKKKKNPFLFLLSLQVYFSAFLLVIVAVASASASSDQEQGEFIAREMDFSFCGKVAGRMIREVDAP